MLCRYEPNALPHHICIASVGVAWDVDIQFDKYGNATKNAISSAPQQFASSNVASVYDCNIIRVRQMNCNVSQNKLFGKCTNKKTSPILIVNSHNNSGCSHSYRHMNTIQKSSSYTSHWLMSHYSNDYVIIYNEQSANL